jgi:hypothetical protein
MWEIKSQNRLYFMYYCIPLLSLKSLIFLLGQNELGSERLEPGLDCGRNYLISSCFRIHVQGCVSMTMYCLLVPVNEWTQVNLSQTNSSQLWSICPSSNLSQLFSKWLYFFFSQIFKEMCMLITLSVETESQYCSFTTFFFLFRGCYLHILLHTLIVIGVNSCSTDPNNNKIEK